MAAALLLSSLLVLLTACGSQDLATSEDAGGAAEDTALRDGGAAAPMAEDPAAGGGENAAEGGADGEVDASERAVVHTASMTVEVEDIDEAAEAAKEQVAALDGRVMAEVASNERSERPRTALTLQVPVDDFDAALEDLAALGERKNLDRHAEDVTEAVADVDSRLESAEADIEALRELMAEAEDVEDVLAVRTELDARQAEAEALQARQRALSQQTDFATVTLEFIPPDTYEPEDPGGPGGFLEGLRDGWDAVVLAARGVATAAGWLLPWLVILGVLAAPLWLWRRRRRERRRGPAQPPVGEAGAGDPAEDPAEDAAPSGG